MDECWTVNMTVYDGPHIHRAARVRYTPIRRTYRVDVVYIFAGAALVGLNRHRHQSWQKHNALIDKWLASCWTRNSHAVDSIFGQPTEKILRASANVPYKSAMFYFSASHLCVSNTHVMCESCTNACCMHICKFLPKQCRLICVCCCSECCNFDALPILFIKWHRK